MSDTWRFPLYIIPITGGFVSVSDNAAGEPEQSLLVFSESAAAVLFIATFDVLSAPKALHNARELGWLLRGLQYPVTRLLLDANPQNPESSSGKLFTVEEVLRELRPDLSPWNYPVFALATDAGFVTIDGVAEDGEYLSAIALFGSPEQAEQYLLESGDQAELCPLESFEDAVIFLQGVASMVGAAALDPVVTSGRHTAKYCFSIETLLTKYLVRE